MKLILSSVVLGLCLFSSSLVFSDLQENPRENEKRGIESSRGKKKRYEVVGLKGDKPGYAHIQDAIDAARVDGASSRDPAVVVVESGKYKENLTLYDGIEIEGPEGELFADEETFVEISGSYTTPQEGSAILKNVAFLSPRTGFEYGFNDWGKIDYENKEREENAPRSFILSATERTNPSLTNSSEVADCVACIDGSLVINGNSGSTSPSGGTFTISGGSTGLTTSETAPSTIALGGVLNVSSGGTGDTSLTNDGILYGSGTSPVRASAALTNGQVLIGSTGNAPVPAPLQAGTGITVTNGAGSIAIAGINAFNLVPLTPGDTSYMPSSGTSYVFVQVVGGGGAGGGASASGAGEASAGAGGGAGGYAAAYYTLSELTTNFGLPVPVAVGSGGVPVAGGSGGNGNSTSFGTTGGFVPGVISANGGGGGGVAQSASTSFAIGGVGQTGHISGSAAGWAGAGSDGQSIVNVSFLGNYFSGGGGSGQLSAGGTPLLIITGSTAASAGAVGDGPGAGGSGAYTPENGTAEPGGAGNDGVIYIIEFQSL